jgi:hypothetical protein
VGFARTSDNCATAGVLNAAIANKQRKKKLTDSMIALLAKIVIQLKRQSRQQQYYDYTDELRAIQRAMQRGGRSRRKTIECTSARLLPNLGRLQTADQNVDEIFPVQRLQAILAQHADKFWFVDCLIIRANEDTGNGPLHAYRVGDRKQARQLL